MDVDATPKPRSVLHYLKGNVEQNTILLLLIKIFFEYILDCHSVLYQLCQFSNEPWSQTATCYSLDDNAIAPGTDD